MKILVSLLLWVALAAAASAEPFPAATPESQGLSTPSLRNLLDVMRGLVDKGDIVGGELLVIKNRRTVLHAAVGLSDLESKKPLRPDTIYCIRSMTKPLMGAAVQILIDEGRLSLDDTASKYLPSFDNEKSRGITVRQLLTHTGGLPFSSLLSTNFRALKSLRDVADISGKIGPAFPPGSRFQYSDDGADTLGAIVSAITGEPAEAFISKRILEPLGMHDTFPLVRDAGDKLNRFTAAYRGSRGDWMRFWSPQDEPIFPYFLASQSMYSTTQDYARFLALYLDDGRAGDKRVLSEAAVRRTLDPINATRIATGFPGLSTYYGQLMIDYVDANRKLVAFGHGGSDGTWAYAWPQHDLMVLFFTQSRGNQTNAQVEVAIDRLLLGGTAVAPIDRDLTAEAAAPYLGLYWAEPLQRPMIVVLHDGRLALELPWKTVRDLKATAAKDVWSFVAEPQTLAMFRRDGDAPATALELRRDRTDTLPRFVPESGLPGLDELFERRPDRKRAQQLRALGTIRMSGGIERTTSQEKASFELLSAGDQHSRLKVNLGGGEIQYVVADKRVWMQPVASSPLEEMPEGMARATRLGGWLRASGDWRSEFKQARVLKRVELDGKSVFLVHAAPEEGRQRLVYLDPENGLTLGYDEANEMPGMGMIGSAVRFADYRDIDGVQIPFKRTVKYSTPMLGTWTFQIEKIETHLKLGKDPFTIK